MFVWGLCLCLCLAASMLILPSFPHALLRPRTQTHTPPDRPPVIVLTTHSMEEADVLGDSIAIMARGNLLAYGNSIHLKNKFGAGYRISIITVEAESGRVKAALQALVPAAVLEDDSAGALIYQFPASSLPAIPAVVAMLERNEHGHIKTWGISQSTLEEVFLKLIRQVAPTNVLHK